MFIYQYRKLGPKDDYYIRNNDNSVEELDDFTQVVELLGTAVFLGKTVERMDFPTDNCTVWKIQ